MFNSEPVPTMRKIKTKPTKAPAGFIVPAQPVERDKPPHEIKHDGYRMIVRREGETVRIIIMSLRVVAVLRWV